MKTVVIYDSQFGNTKHIAEAIAMRLEAGGMVQVLNVNNGLPDLHAIDVLVAGAPTQAHNVSPAMRAFLDQVPPGALREVCVAAFGTRVPGPELFTGSAAHGIAKQLTKKGGYLLIPPEEFIVTGREGPLAEGEVDRAATWAEKLLAAAQEIVEEPLPAGR